MHFRDIIGIDPARLVLLAWDVTLSKGVSRREHGTPSLTPGGGFDRGVTPRPLWQGRRDTPRGDLTFTSLDVEPRSQGFFGRRTR